MDFKTLVSDLGQKFTIDTIDISPFFTKGESWLYNTMMQYHRNSYSNNYRLVFYFNDDNYLYNGRPGELTYTFQKFIAKLDISAFFVILITSKKVTVSELMQANTILANDKQNFYNIDTSITIKHYDAENITCIANPSVIDNNNNTTNCEKLWNHLHINVNGDVLPCCSSNHNHAFGNISKNNINDIYQSSVANGMRKTMLYGERNIACESCYKLESDGFKSPRVPLSIDKIKSLNKDGTVDEIKIESMDIRLSNICNLKCRMCTGNYSSKIAKEEHDEFGVEYSVLPINSIEISKQIIQLLPNIEKIYFAGGEPLMMSSHYQILDELIRLGKTDIKISYNTNFTILKYKNTPITNYWRKFTNIHVGASLDAMNKHIEYIRHGTVWDDVVHNYDNICDDESINIDFSITANINIFNAFNLIHAQRFWIEDKNLLPPKHSISILTDPPELCIQTLPLEFKHKLDTMIETHIVFLGNYDSIQLVKTWTEIRKFLWKRDNSAMISSFFNTVDRLDSIRDENFDEVFTEYSDLRTK